MSDKNRSTTLSAAVRMLLALVFVFAQSAWAVDNQSAGAKKNAGAQAAPQKPSAASAAQNESAEEPAPVAGQKASSDGRHEGIKVHGHWTIEVRNPDGTVVTHREFENALSPPTGPQLLVSLLNAQGAALSQPFLWGVILTGSSALGGSATSCGGHDCLILQAGGGETGGSIPGLITWDSSDLIATAPTGSSANAGSYVLSGSVMAPATTAIAAVSTETLSSSGGFGVSPPVISTFTGTNLRSPISVSAGQTIAVTVIISFS